MTDADALRVIAVLTSYYRQELSDETCMLWAAELRQFERDDALAAAQGCARSGRFMPSLAEFIAEIKAERNHRLSQVLPRLPEPASMTAQEAMKASPALAAVAAKHGWFTGKERAREPKRANGKPNVLAQMRAAVLAQRGPTTANPDLVRKQANCDQHEFLIHDRCHWCGVSA